MRQRLVGIGDLARPGGRWIYSRQGVHLLTRTRDFPEPVAAINQGRTLVWYLDEIVLYERAHPELYQRRTEAAQEARVEGAARRRRYRPRR